jgi:hypothetical protein
LPTATSPGSACLPPWQALSHYQYFELWPFILHNRILHHHNSAPTQAGAALIALEIQHYEAVFANQIFSPVKPHMRSL